MAECQKAHYMGKGQTLLCEKVWGHLGPHSFNVTWANFADDSISVHVHKYKIINNHSDLKCEICDHMKAMIIKNVECEVCGSLTNKHTEEECMK